MTEEEEDYDGLLKRWVETPIVKPSERAATTIHDPMIIIFE